MTEPNRSETPKKAHPVIAGLLGFIFKIALPIVIVALAVGFFRHQMNTRPKTERRPPMREARLVTVRQAEKTSAFATVPAMGTVTPARQITLSPEVTGVITRIDPAVVPGGLVQAGQVLYEIDSRDYDAVVKQRESELSAAQLQYKLESGSQAVAQQEYELLEEIVTDDEKELVLRQPHLESARQRLAAAQAALEKARLDVERCRIRAPFNAVINAKMADLGARVSPTGVLAQLTGTDEFWIEAPVFMSQLKWIQVPAREGQAGSTVRVYNPAAWGDETYREGRIIQLLSTLEEDGRLARLLVSVPDPLHLADHNTLPPLLIGSYVRLEVLGREMTDVVTLPREQLRDGRFVWVMNDRNRLEIRPVEITYGTRENVFIADGLRKGEQIVTTDLSTPVEGMPLRTAEMEAPESVLAENPQPEGRP